MWWTIIARRKHILKPSPYYLWTHAGNLSSRDPCFPHVNHLALGMNQTAIKGVSLSSFYEKRHKIQIHRHNTGKACLRGTSMTTLHTEDYITCPTWEAILPQHDSKIILKNKTDLHLDRQFSTIDRQKRTTTKEYTIMELNGHPTLDGSKERVAWMENPEKQTHVLNQDYGVVPSVATSALWRNLV